jgi:hypothetical protein
MKNRSLFQSIPRKSRVPLAADLAAGEPRQADFRGNNFYCIKPVAKLL